mgnify:FL=1
MRKSNRFWLAGRCGVSDRRQRVGPELMDGEDFGRREVVATFRYLAPTNRAFGGVRPLIRFLEREGRQWQPDRTYRILDVGCGLGDIPVAVARWARRRGQRLRLEAIDINPITAEMAQSYCSAYPEISVLCQDALAIADGAYDSVFASLFLLHCADGELTQRSM